MLASSVLDHGLESCSEQTKDYRSDIYYFFTEHAALRSKNKDSSWLSWNQDNLSELQFFSLYFGTVLILQQI